MTFAELQSAVRTEMHESGTEFYSDQDIKDAINDGYAEMADATEFYERQWNVLMLKWRTYYDLSTILPDTFLSPRRCWSNQAQWWLQPSNPLEMDRHTFAQWELTKGAPDRYWMRGNWWLGVFPKTSTEGGTIIRFVGTAIPTAMSDSTDVPAFPREFHRGLVEYAKYDLYAQQRETKKSLAEWKIYSQYQAALAGFVEGRTSLAEVRIV